MLKYEGFDHLAGAAPETPYKNTWREGAPSYADYVGKIEQKSLRTIGFKHFLQNLPETTTTTYELVTYRYTVKYEVPRPP